MTETKVSTSAIPDTAIGIDLGTSFCRVAIWQNGKVTVIPNKLGNKMSPSYVGFGQTRNFVGEAAKNQRFIIYTSTYQNIKRLLGVGFNDEKIQETNKPYLFEKHGEQLRCRGSYSEQSPAKQFAPEEVVAMLLMEMKEIAEAHLGGSTKVKDAVITVPSYFNQSQRQATLNAGKIAGLNVLRLINDPTAAALAYELNKDFIDVETSKKIMFYCFGGGSLSVSIVEIQNGSTFKVLSTAGNSHLGGIDFDNKLFKYCLEQFEGKHSEDLKEDFNSKLRLKVACEKAKRKLSSYVDTSIVINHLVDEIDLITEVTRTRFENLCADLFQSAMDPVQKALETAKLDKSEISDVVLVGGSTRIPKIQKLLQDYFNGKELIMPSSTEELVVYGAAVQAAVLAGTPKNAAVPKVEVSDVTPFSFVYPVAGGIKRKINESNRKIPFVESRRMMTTVNNQTEIGADISEASSQIKVGDVVFTVPPAPAGVSKVSFEFKMDANGILHALQKLVGGSTEEVRIVNPGTQLSPAEILQMTSDAVKYKLEEDQQRKLTLARNQLEDCISNVKQATEEALKKVNERYNQVASLIFSGQLTDVTQIASELGKIRNDLNPLVTKDAEILRLQSFMVRPEDKPDSTQGGNGEPATKKARTTRLKCL